MTSAVVCAFHTVIFASASCWIGSPKPRKGVQRLGGQKFNKCPLERKASQSDSGAALPGWRWKVFKGQQGGSNPEQQGLQEAGQRSFIPVAGNQGQFGQCVRTLGAVTIPEKGASCGI